MMAHCARGVLSSDGLEKSFRRCSNLVLSCECRIAQVLKHPSMLAENQVADVFNQLLDGLGEAIVNGCRPSFGLPAVALVSLFLASSCSVILDPTQTQCSSDDDCKALGEASSSCVDGMCQLGGVDAAPSGPWGCVGSVDWPAADPTEPIETALTFQKLMGRTPIDGLTVYTCRPFDLECSDPLGSGKTGADGIALMPMYKGFDGHIYVPEQEIYEGMMPLLVFSFPPPAVSSTESPGTAIVTKAAELDTVATLGGASIVAGCGHLTFTVFDCESNRAPGVKVEVEPFGPDTQPIYVSDNNMPTTTLEATSNLAEGAVLNVPPGTVNITASTEEQGVFLRTTVLVVADSITGLGLAPGEL